MPKPILFFDMDNVLVNFQSGIDRLDEATKQAYEGNLDDVSGIFALMDPMPGALEAVHKPYKADSCKKVDWMKDSSLTVCGSGCCVSLASGRFRSTQLCALASRRFRSTQLCALASRGFRSTQLCALASRGFRSTLTRLAEWCNALGNKKGKRRAATERLLATALFSPPPVFSPFPRSAARTIPFGQAALTKGDGTAGCHRADGRRRM